MCIRANAPGGKEVYIGKTLIFFFVVQTIKIKMCDTSLPPTIALASSTAWGHSRAALPAVFPVFFKSAVQLNPAATNSVLAATPLFLAPFSFLARYISVHIGAHAHTGAQVQHDCHSMCSSLAMRHMSCS